MKLLLDTHVLLWFRLGATELPGKYRDAIRNPKNEVFVSVASVWELAIKLSKGKLELPEDFFETFSSTGFKLLSVTARSTPWRRGLSRCTTPILSTECWYLRPGLRV